MEEGIQIGEQNIVIKKERITSLTVTQLLFK